jgi:large subunit ribosomal protein L18
MIRKESRKERRKIRHLRVRKKLSGTPDVPRLAVYKSLKHFYAQIIDDQGGVTLFGASTLTPEFKDLAGGNHHSKTEYARTLGKYVGEKALAKGIKKVAFDRGGYPYHGRVRAFAEGAREAGLEF